MAAAQATTAEQEYLESLFWLYEARLPMTGANLARAMQLSAPTVHEMLGRLERDGYIERTAGRGDRVHRDGPRARRADRRPPPDDRALPDRRRRGAVGRRPRGGREARVRDDAALRGLRPLRRRRRRDLPPRPSDPGRRADRRRARWPTARSAPRSPSCGSRTRPRTSCTTSRRRGSSPGWRARSPPTTASRCRSATRRQPASTVTFSVAETVSVLADPSPPPRTALPEQLVLGRERYGR